MKIRVFVEKGKNGTYGAYMPDDNNLPFGLIGEGNTIQEAMNDFLLARDDMKDYYKETGKPFPEDLEFTFGYDIPSFLAYYSDRLSLAGLEHITGVAQGQLSHYVNGRRNPSKKTAEKIQAALQQFGKELSNVHFV